MKSATTAAFWRRYRALPEDVRAQARRSYALWKKNPKHPGLQFKAVSGYRDLYAVRVGIHWRALGRMRRGTLHWFWIGPHAEYDRILSDRGLIG